MSKKDLTEKAKKVKGRFKTLRALPYRGSMIYLRVFDGVLFEWLLIFKNELYTGYLVIIPKKGKTKLTKVETAQSAALALQGALATIDMKLGIKPTDQEKEAVRLLEGSRKSGKKKLVN